MYNMSFLGASMISMLRCTNKDKVYHFNGKTILSLCLGFGFVLGGGAGFFGAKVMDKIGKESVSLASFKKNEVNDYKAMQESLLRTRAALYGLDWVEWKLTAAALKAELPVEGVEFSISETSDDSLQMTLNEMAQNAEENTRQMAKKVERLAALATLINDSAATGDLSAALPVFKGKVSSKFGTRRDPFTGRAASHYGLDFPAQEGTPIKAVAAGIVEKAEWHNEYGFFVDINHGNGYMTRYGHASELSVESGEWVAKGQKIGKVGSTGRSTGPHLHFETRVAGKAKDPATFIAKK